MDEISIWKERVVQNFPLIDADKVRKAFDDGLNVYRDPKTRYKFKNPYHTECETYPDALSESDCLDSAFGSGWAAGVFERKETCVRCGHIFTPKGLTPKTCPNPKCRSPYWNKPRRVKGSESTEPR